MSDVKILCKSDSLLDPKALTAHPQNPNQHSEEQTKRLAKMIKKVGFRAPIVVSKNSKFIVKGHGTLLAAMHLKMKQVPVVFQEFFTEDEEYAYMVGDNAIADWSRLDLSKVNLQLENLGPDFDLEILGLKDFGLDPPELKVETEGGPAPDGVESVNGGGINVIRLFFPPADYPELLRKAEALMEAHKLTDMSQLFQALVMNAYEAL